MSDERDDAVADETAADETAPGPNAPGETVAGGTTPGATGPDGTTTDGTAPAETAPDAMVDANEPPPSPATRFRMRRAPRYRPFGLTGALIGVVAGLVLALSFTAASNYSMQTIAGYFAAIFGLIGAVIGLGLAVLFERRRRS